MTTSTTMQRFKVGIWVISGIIVTTVVVTLIWSLFRPPVKDGPMPPYPPMPEARLDAGPG